MAIAVIRGIARRETNTIGNFWVDMTRRILWVLLPACLVVATVFRFAGSDSEPEALHDGAAGGSADGAGHRAQTERRRSNK